MVATIDVVHIGAACRDITTDDPRGWRLGGGVSYAALTTARLGLRTAALVGADEATAAAGELDLLRRAGVDLRIAPLDEGPVFENRETPSGRVQVCHALGRPLEIVDLPPAWRSAAGWSIVPVADEVTDGWAAVVPELAYLAVGWQGLLRDLRVGSAVARRPPRPSPVVRRADLIGLSGNDVDGAIDDAGLATFLAVGADLLVTEGALGGRLVRIGANGPGRVRRYRSIAAEQADPTGAGDTFLAALLASVLRPADQRAGAARGEPDLAFAAAAGSLVVEGHGLAAVPDRDAVLGRLDRLARLDLGS